MMEDFEAPVSLNISSQDVVQKWAQYAIDAFHNAMQKKKVGLENRNGIRGIRAGELWNSFENELKASNGNVDEVIIKFLRYGRFVDMGAGRGYSLGEQKLNKQFDVYKNSEGRTVGRHARQPKKWYSKTYAYQVHRLTEIYRDVFGEQLVLGLENSLKGSITTNI